ncbi:MAG: putative porin [Flavobacteriaceae bacterium]|nr:putative porin [Flavobacteriaceae bacterium]
MFFVIVSQAQITPKKPIKSLRGVDGFQGQMSDSTVFGKKQNIILSGKTHFTDYKIISYQKDTTYIDTTLTIHKDYKFNYLKKDDFELLPFHNQGQTFNQLGYDFSKVSLLPKMGASAKHYNFYEVEDINYYQVATPTTVLFYRGGLEQGQVLDALFTFNTSKRHNGSLSYKGLRSLGKYRNALSSHGNMRFTYSYITKNNAYTLRSHIVAQDLTNNESGGLTSQSIINFESNDGNFTDRGRLETNFNDASNILRANRYYIEHDYKIWQRKDSLNNTKSYLKVGHILNYERKHYDFKQNTANTSVLGNTFSASVDDKLTYITFDNQAFLALKSPIVLGEVKFKANYFDYNYGYQSATFIGNQLIPSNLDGSTISIGGEWKTNFKKFNINAEASTLITGDFNGNFLKTTATFKQDSLFTFKGTFLTNSKSPNLNFLLNQSDYVSYNWFNNLKNERTRSLVFDLTSKKLLNASAQITQIDNYTYFGNSDTSAQPLPVQADKTINYLKLKVSKEFKLGKFALNNTIMYQKVAQGESAFRVPEFVTRNTFYFSDHLFKRDPLYLQAGITFKYFSEYFANSYNPLLAEFNIQNNQKIGGYPVFDFFINAQIQRTRIYLKAEHFNSSFTNTPNYYTAPNYPYRDFIIRFGLVWNFFI